MATPMLVRPFYGGQSLSILARCSRCRHFSSGPSEQNGRQFSSAPSETTVLKQKELKQSFKVPFVNAKLPKSLLVGSSNPETKVTTLQNGLRVASNNMYADYCILGVLIDSGSRYEVNYTSGVNHFLSKLAFNKTTQYSSSEHIKEEVEKVGGVINSQNSRDTMIYLMATDSEGIPVALNILAEAVLRPEITEEELNHAKQTIAFELEAIDMNPIPDTILTELIFSAGYRNNTLGLPSVCPAENINKMDIKTIYTYLSNFYDPHRMVLTGIGVDHEDFVQQAEKIFASKTPVWKEDRIAIDETKGWDDSISQYTGGLVKLEKDLSSVSLGPNPMPDLAHVMIGLESCSHQHDDFVAFCVLNSLLGGGSSFSSGGPGKGMYSRLYLNVLNRHYFVNDAVSYNNAFLDSGLFCIHGSCPPNQLGNLVDVISKELVNTTGRITEVEMNRAKKSLQSFYLMNLEQKIVVMEDVGRQVLSQNMRHEAKHYYDLIGSITVQDIQRISEKMLGSKPAVAAYGNLNYLPPLEKIESSLKQSKRFSLFGR